MKRSLLKQPRPSAFDRVLLVIPGSIFLLDERVFVSLGILKVAAALERASIKVDVLDLSGIENYEDAVRAAVNTTTTGVVGITATTPQMPAVAKIVNTIRTERPRARIVLGGPHPTLVYSAVKQERKRGVTARAHRAMRDLEAMFDVVVSGDGEISIFEAISAAPPKIVDADDPTSGMFMDDAAYDATPLPARHLIDVDSYHYEIDGHRAGNLIAQLGCPFGCHFCGGRNSNMLRRIRTRTTQSIVDELEHLYVRYGLTAQMLMDDELNVSRTMIELMHEITALQQRLGAEFRFRGFIKAELFTAEQAGAMYTAGFRWLLCGFEAAHERILTNINKKATLEDNTRVVKLCHDHGLKIKALMSVGHAGERTETIRAVRDWLIEVKPDDFDCTVITTYPGTPYYDEAVPHESLPDVWTYTAKKTGDRLHAYDLDYMRVADYYKGDPEGGYKAYVFTDYLSSEKIVELRDWVEKDVRSTLKIPYNPSAAARRYEHSMGQSELPPFILRSSTRQPNSNS